MTDRFHSFTVALERDIRKALDALNETEFTARCHAVDHLTRHAPQWLAELLAECEALTVKRDRYLHALELVAPDGRGLQLFLGDALAAEIATLTARVEHYKRACITTSAEVTRVLGEALYGPNPDAWSTHTPEAIADEAAAEIATLRAENERMRGEIITYQDAHTTGTEIIDGLRAKVEALEANDDVIELIRVAIDPDEPRLSGSCRAMVDVWLGRVEAARKAGG